MILKALKEKSNKKYLNKMLSQRKVNVGDSKIKSLGIILNIDEVGDFSMLSELTTLLKLHTNKVKIIAYTMDSKNPGYSWNDCFTEKDFGKNGKIKNAQLQLFLDEPFDALVSYYTKDHLELKLLTVLSKSQFKIGILQTDLRLNDLIIKTEVKEFDVFKKEFLKYLTILNKI